MVRKFIVSLVILVLCLGINAYCEDVFEMPESGTLARSSSTARGGGHNAPAGGVSLDEESSSPLSGSVRRVSNSEFEYTVSNSSEDKYSVSVALDQYNKSGKKLRTSRSQVYLSANQKVSRKLRVVPSVESIALQLVKWKKKTKTKSSEEIVAEIQKKKEEIKALETELVGVK